MSAFSESLITDHLKLARRQSPFSVEGFDVENTLWNEVRILVVGAGGLGCEILHTLALSGFHKIEVIDMDTIELSNLNRQFLFRTGDIGKPKSEVAAAAVKRRCPWIDIKAHFKKVQEMPDSFYESFHVILMGLDSITARQWVNAKVAQLAEWDEVPSEEKEGEMVTRIVNAIPIIDGGTEGFQGSVRTILLGKTACIECAMYLYPPTRTVPMCTLENIPRQPEHCVLYVKEKLWRDLRPNEELSADVPEHIQWVTAKAVERQQQFQIAGRIDYAFTLGVVKNVVPAVGFSNALVAAMTVQETFKLVTGAAPSLNCFHMYHGGVEGLTSNVQFIAPDDTCPVCSGATAVASFDLTPTQLIDTVLSKHQMNAVWNLKKPSLDTNEQSQLNDVSLKAYLGGRNTNPKYLQYQSKNPLKDTAVEGKTIRELLTGYDPSLSWKDGIWLETVNNGIVVSVLLKETA